MATRMNLLNPLKPIQIRLEDILLTTITLLLLITSTVVHSFTIPPATTTTTTTYIQSNNRLSSSYTYSTIRYAQSNNNNDNNIEESNNENKMNDNEKEIMSAEQLELEVKKYKAQAEIDAILNDPEDPFFDLETELKKVNGISPPLPINSIEKSIEDNIHTLESEMYDAVQYKKDYNFAQRKKEEIDSLHIDDCGYVLATNAEFYKAFSNKDFEKMEDIWLHDACAVCIHPSQKPILGASAVLKSWEKMFQSGNDGFQRNKIVPTNIRLCVKGTTATVTCDEEVYTRRFVRGKKRGDENDGMELVNKLTATNILRKVGGKWYMMQHHASWHHESDAAKKAMNAQMNIGDRSSKKLAGEAHSTVEGLLGIPGHEGLGGEKKKAGERKGPVRRVFTGSLSDLLGGGLNDILKGDMDDSNDLIEDDDDSDDDNDDDDDDEGIIIANMLVNGGGQSSSSKNSNIITLKGQDQTDKNSKRDKTETKDNVRQNCIATLRKLSSRGIISPKHKRMLLTDIITNSAKGEYSLVEVAYDLLCGEGDDKDAAEEDFAEQCQVFVATLPEVPI